MIDLDELKALRAKMTPGPWLATKARSSIVGIPIVSTHEGQVIANCSGHHPDDPASYISQCLANAAGIVALVNASDALIAELEAARAENARLTAELKRGRHGDLCASRFGGHGPCDCGAALGGTHDAG